MTPSETEELKLRSCPFCPDGGEPKRNGTVSYPDDYAAFCAACGASGPDVLNMHNGSELWNTRPLEDALKEENEKLKIDNIDLKQRLEYGAASYSGLCERNNIAEQKLKLLELQLADRQKVADDAVSASFEMNNKLSKAREALKRAEEWAHSDFCSGGECHTFHIEISKALAEIECLS